MLETKKVTIQCPECSGISFEKPDDLKDDDFVKCVQCNFEILFGDLKQISFAQTKQQIKEEIKANFTKALKNNLRRR